MKPWSKRSIDIPLPRPVDIHPLWTVCIKKCALLYRSEACHIDIIDKYKHICYLCKLVRPPSVAPALAVFAVLAVLSAFLRDSDPELGGLGDLPFRIRCAFSSCANKLNIRR
jgi:hypothetical protein